MIHDGNCAYNVTLRRMRVNVYSSLSMSKEWYCFGRRKRFCDDNFASSNETCFSYMFQLSLCLPDFSKVWVFSTGWHRSLQYQILRKFIQWELCWYMWRDEQADGQRDGWTVMMRVTGAFLDFANALVKGTLGKIWGLWTGSNSFTTHDDNVH
jgi:hypothetical protein